MAEHEKAYAICENKCLVPVDEVVKEIMPKISYGYQLPPDSEGNQGDIFILLGGE